MPAGRPSKYRKEFAEQAYKLALLGLSDEELARFFGVQITTIYQWSKVHKEFSNARARGKEPADGAVAERLYKRALGYSHEAVKILMPAGANEPIYAPYTEHYPPDTQAATWWLRNRQPAKWKDRQEHTGADGGPIQITVAAKREEARKMLDDVFSEPAAPQPEEK